APARPVPVGASVLGRAALLNGEQGQVQSAVGVWCRGGEHRGGRGIRPFQRREGQFRRSVGVLQRVDHLFRRLIIGQLFALSPLTQQDRDAVLLGVVARRLG